MKFLLIILFPLYMIPVNAQEISSHQWQDRLLLVLAEDSTNENFRNQMKILKESRNGLQERKLVVYQILPGKYKKGISKEAPWHSSDDLFKKFKFPRSKFEVILIGLDGGQKLKESKTIPIQTIFSTIDAMPMRKAEMRKKG